MPVNLWMPYHAHARFIDLDLDALSQWFGNGHKISVACSSQLCKQLNFATTVGHFLRDVDLDFENIYTA